ncbi:hypothetical protein [Pediococcus pentosaceus]|uniref:hypothetical protein n=1 Tax=Pediococcus pentosaceus TaxID=1255 RepID=UPI0039821F70
MKVKLSNGQVLDDGQEDDVVAFADFDTTKKLAPDEQEKLLKEMSQLRRHLG